MHLIIKLTVRVLLFAVGIFFCLAPRLIVAATPSSELQSFSHFKNIDLDALYSGQILSDRGSSLQSTVGLSAQFCYLAKRPQAVTEKFLIGWPPSSRADMGIYLTRNFASSEKSGFEQLRFNQTNRPTVLFLEAMRQGSTSGLYITSEEEKQLKAVFASLPESDRHPGSGPFRQAAERFWIGVLKSRYDIVRGGGIDALPEFEVGGKKVQASREISSMLADTPEIRSRFANVLGPVTGGSGPGPVLYYWQYFKADTTATLCMGAFYRASSGSDSRVVDCQFYTATGYLSSITLYDLFPVTVKGKECTLILRADFVSAPDLVSLRGVGQMAAAMLMSRSIKQSVEYFLSDLEKITASN